MTKRRQRLRRARRAYVANPTKVLLRRYLIYKARLGRWDDRYCRWYGVSPDVNAGCRRFIMHGYARGLVPTSTKRTGSASYHAQRNSAGEGLAADLGLIERHVGTAYGREKMADFQRSEYRHWAKGERKNMVELIGPDNSATVLRGRRAPLPEGADLEQQHDNHVHGAFRG